VLAQTGSVQRRVRDLPSRVVVYLLLAAGLFPEVGYGQVWARMIAGLDGLAPAVPSPSALAQARRRVGAAPLRALFDLLCGPVSTGLSAGLSGRGVFWRGRLVTAIDGTMLCCPDTESNLTVFRRGGGYQGGTGYPLIRVLALVACGTRTIIDATFGTDRTGETSYAGELIPAMRAGTIVLADRNFAAAAWIAAVARTGADVLVRVKIGRSLPVCRRLPDGTYLSRIGPVEVRVLTAAITVATAVGHRSEVYRLVTTVCDATYPAGEIIRLYHERWEIETAFFELKSTILGGRVLRARTPNGVDQEIYALLITYQALRIAINDATLTRPGLDPDRGSFTIALHTARDQIVNAAGVLPTATTTAAAPAAATAPGIEVVDLVGVIGRCVLRHLLPQRRPRSNPRVVKRAISVHAANTARGRIRGPSHRTTITIDIVHPEP
jgi:hypothetical protein